MTEGWIDLDHEFDLDIAYDPSQWLEIPPRWETETWQDIRAWAQECAELLWRSYGQDPGESGIPFLADTLRRCADAFVPEGFDTRVLLRVWDPLTMPLPLVAVVRPAEGERDQTLHDFVLAEDSQAVEAPVVEEHRAKLVGDGLRAFCYLRQDDGPEVLAGLRYAWRDDEAGADVVLWTATDDVGQILRAADDIERLTHSVRVRELLSRTRLEGS
ncbi:hypothetical protein [Streptomyces sp. NPDC005485]|uniref:hypothetical protein n=1 Tax=Streptomyces sp. NPDC005485 TaxID=3155591 RepID=UPI0033A35645